MLQGCKRCSDQQAVLCVQSCSKPPLMLNGCERCLSSPLSIHSCRPRPRGRRLRAHEQQSATLWALLNDFKGTIRSALPVSRNSAIEQRKFGQHPLRLRDRHPANAPQKQMGGSAEIRYRRKQRICRWSQITGHNLTPSAANRLTGKKAD